MGHRTARAVGACTMLSALAVFIASCVVMELTVRYQRNLSFLTKDPHQFRQFLTSVSMNESKVGAHIQAQLADSTAPNYNRSEELQKVLDMVHEFFDLHIKELGFEARQSFESSYGVTVEEWENLENWQQFKKFVTSFEGYQLPKELLHLVQNENNTIAAKDLFDKLLMQYETDGSKPIDIGENNRTTRNARQALADAEMSKLAESIMRDGDLALSRLMRSVLSQPDTTIPTNPMDSVGQEIMSTVVPLNESQQIYLLLSESRPTTEEGGAEIPENIVEPGEYPQGLSDGVMKPNRNIAISGIVDTTTKKPRPRSQFVVQFHLKKGTINISRVDEPEEVDDSISSVSCLPPAYTFAGLGMLFSVCQFFLGAIGFFAEGVTRLFAIVWIIAVLFDTCGHLILVATTWVFFGDENNCWIMHTSPWFGYFIALRLNLFIAVVVTILACCFIPSPAMSSLSPKMHPRVNSSSSLASEEASSSPTPN